MKIWPQPIVAQPYTPWVSWFIETLIFSFSCRLSSKKKIFNRFLILFLKLFSLKSLVKFNPIRWTNPPHEYYEFDAFESILSEDAFTKATVFLGKLFFRRIKIFLLFYLKYLCKINYPLHCDTIVCQPYHWRSRFKIVLINPS